MAISFAAMGMAACLTVGVFAAPKTKVDAAKIREYVKKLAGDEFEAAGQDKKAATRRRSGSRNSFESFGLKPAGDKGTFFQDVRWLA